MIDISLELSDAIDNDSLQQLIKKYNADPTLNYSVSDIPVSITSFAFNESIGSENSLENLSNHSKRMGSGNCLAIEIAATALLDKKSLIFNKIIEGEIGHDSGCDWDAGDLLQRSYQEKESSGLEVSLGHTHPGFSGKFSSIYGAIPSWVPFCEGQIKCTKDKKLRNEMLRSGIYKKHRGDFCEIFTRAKITPVSNYSWILSPASDQLGIFEVVEDGVVYHPWIVQPLSKYSRIKTKL